MSELPVVVIGAGPQGLAAAAHLLERGLEPLVLEAGDGPASAVARVGARPAVLAVAGTGRQGRGAAARADRLGARRPRATRPAPSGSPGTCARSRRRSGGRVRYGDQGDRGVPQGPRPAGRRRAGTTSRSPCTSPARTGARSGWTRGRSSTRPARGGSRTRPARTGCPPSASAPPRRAWSATRSRTSPRRSRSPAGTPSCVGAGHSAATAVIELARIAEANPGTRITWALRRGVDRRHASAAAPPTSCPSAARSASAPGRPSTTASSSLVTGFRTERIRLDDAGRAVLVAEDGRELAAGRRGGGADRLPARTCRSCRRCGSTWTRCCRRRARIAPAIDPNVHSCGTATPTLAADLAQPEPGLYLVGMKSYGRAPTFLAMTGYEQVRSVAAELAGDHEAAARVELVLPDTGVCGGAGLFDDPDGASGGGAARPRRRCCRSASPQPAADDGTDPGSRPATAPPDSPAAAGPGGGRSPRCA